MKSDIQLYPDLIKALEKNEIVYLFGAGFSTALSGRKYTWWDWIVDGIGRIKSRIKEFVLKWEQMNYVLAAAEKNSRNAAGEMENMTNRIIEKILEKTS